MIATPLRVTRRDPPAAGLSARGDGRPAGIAAGAPPEEPDAHEKENHEGRDPDEGSLAAGQVRPHEVPGPEDIHGIPAVRARRGVAGDRPEANRAFVHARIIPVARGRRWL